MVTSSAGVHPFVHGGNISCTDSLPQSCCLETPYEPWLTLPAARGSERCGGLFVGHWRGVPIRDNVPVSLLHGGTR